MYVNLTPQYNHKLYFPRAFVPSKLLSQQVERWDDKSDMPDTYEYIYYSLDI